MLLFNKKTITSIDEVIMYESLFYSYGYDYNLTNLYKRGYKVVVKWLPTGRTIYQLKNANNETVCAIDE